jgi:hypothetical protein
MLLSFLVQVGGQTIDSLLVILGHLGVICLSSLVCEQLALGIFQIIDGNDCGSWLLVNALKNLKHEALSEKTKPPIKVAFLEQRFESEQACC